MSTSPYNSINLRQHEEGLEVAPPEQPGLEHDNEKGDGKILAGGYPYFTHLHTTPQPPPKSFGLSPLIIGLLVCLTTTFIVGGAVGGGLGAALASCNSKRPNSSCSNSNLIGSNSSLACSNSTLSSSSIDLSNYAAAAPNTVLGLAWNCPSMNGTNYTTVGFSQDFTIYCGLDYASQSDAVTDKFGKQLYNIISFVAYDFTNCIQACSIYNAGVFSSNQHATACRGVTWHKNLSTITQGNCELKNRVPGQSYVAVENADTFSAACIANCPQ